MTIDELTAKIDAGRNAIKEASGDTILASETGPVGSSIADAILELLRAQESRISELEKKINDIHGLFEIPPP